MQGYLGWIRCDGNRLNDLVKILLHGGEFRRQDSDASRWNFYFLFDQRLISGEVVDIISYVISWRYQGMW